MARALATTRRTLIAAHVESQTQMELCRLLGFHLFQGHYFAKPVIVEGRKLDASTQGLLRLVKRVAEDVDQAVLADHAQDFIFRHAEAGADDVLLEAFDHGFAGAVVMDRDLERLAPMTEQCIFWSGSPPR